jgi:hypothetical protein
MKFEEKLPISSKPFVLDAMEVERVIAQPLLISFTMGRRAG